MIALEYTKADNDITAVEWFDKGLVANPSLHYAYFQKAKAQSRLGMLDAAIFTAEVGITKAQADGNGKAFGELQELQELLAGFQAE